MRSCQTRKWRLIRPVPDLHRQANKRVVCCARKDDRMAKKCIALALRGYSPRWMRNVSFTPFGLNNSPKQVPCCKSGCYRWSENKINLTLEFQRRWLKLEKSYLCSLAFLISLIHLCKILIGIFVITFYLILINFFNCYFRLQKYVLFLQIVITSYKNFQPTLHSGDCNILTHPRFPGNLWKSQFTLSESMWRTLVVRVYSDILQFLI